MKYCIYLLIFSVLFIFSCKSSTQQRNSSNYISVEEPEKLTTEQIRTNLFHSVKRSFDLRISGNYKDLTLYFHPLEWMDWEKQYAQLKSRDEIITFVTEGHRKYMMANKAKGIQARFIFENILDSIYNNNNITYLINYRYESKSKLDTEIYENQVIFTSKNGGHIWKYFRINTSDSAKTLESLKSYYTEREINQLMSNFGNKNTQNHKSNLFRPQTTQEKKLVKNVHAYGEVFFSGKFEKALKYFPDAMFEVLQKEAGANYTIEDVKKLFVNNLSKGFQRKPKGNNCNLVLHKLLKHVQVYSKDAYVLSYSTVCKKRSSSDNDMSETGGVLICIYDRTTYKWNFFEDDNDHSIAVLQKIFNRKIASEILDFKYSK